MGGNLCFRLFDVKEGVKMLREISCDVICDTVAKLSVAANLKLPEDIENALSNALSNEEAPLAKSILSDINKNSEKARELGIPICQDTGMAVVFAEIGQDVHITGGLFIDAVNRGVKKGYEEGLLRKSIVSDPLR
ncbi:MAG: fumarate hydratase, partial [Clostridia bacterium]|nr:fumarate hydratase [Clostridia bacterium]